MVKTDQKYLFDMDGLDASTMKLIASQTGVDGGNVVSSPEFLQDKVNGKYQQALPTSDGTQRIYHAKDPIKDGKNSIMLSKDSTNDDAYFAEGGQVIENININYSPEKKNTVYINSKQQKRRLKMSGEVSAGRIKPIIGHFIMDSLVLSGVFYLMEDKEPLKTGLTAAGAIALSDLVWLRDLPAKLMDKE